MGNIICKNGLSGIMRVRNEERYLSACIDSCVNALDELIIVYNDCTDDSPAIIEAKARQYPDKIKAFSYNHNVLSHNLNKEEFEYAKSLPEDSLQLHSNQCNFALSQVTYKYAVKIDADQIYIESEVKKWRDICFKGDRTFKLSTALGFIFSLYFSFYRRVSSRRGKPCLFLLPELLCRFLYKSYSDYARWMLINDKASVAWSGLNVFYDGSWFVPFDGINVHPPYNGEGDTMIFKVCNETFFSKFYREGPPYSVIELFNHPYGKMTFGAPVWFHLHANRPYCFEKVLNVKKSSPELFLALEDFLSLSYKQVHDKMDHKAHSLYQRVLFAYVHNVGIQIIKDNKKMLQNLTIEI